MFDTAAASFTPDRQDSRLKNDGNIDTAHRRAGGSAGRVRVPYLAQAPLEPINAEVELKDGRLDIWTGPNSAVHGGNGGQGQWARDDKIHLHPLFSGGSFGRRLEDDYVRQAVELANAYQGRPIKTT